MATNSMDQISPLCYKDVVEMVVDQMGLTFARAAATCQLWRDVYAERRNKWAVLQPPVAVWGHDVNLRSRCMRLCGLQSPSSIAAAPPGCSQSGCIFVSDPGKNRIAVFSALGEFRREILPQEDYDRFLPAGLALAPDGDVLVSAALFKYTGELIFDGDDPFLSRQITETHHVLRLNGRGVIKAVAGGAPAADAGCFNQPAGMCTAPGSEAVFVVDRGNGRVVMLDAQLGWVRTFGSKGDGPGQLSSPEGIAAHGPSGSLFVSDQGQSRIHVFGFDGAFKRRFGESGKHAGGLREPCGLTILPQHDGGASFGHADRLLVNDVERLQIFSLEGVVLQVVTVPGADFCESCAFGGLIYATDMRGNRVNVIRLMQDGHGTWLQQRRDMQRLS